MRSRVHSNYGITHSLTPALQMTPPRMAEYDVPEQPEKKYSPLYKKATFFNPHSQRSRKHRLLQEKNTDIERENRRLYEKLRKIKLKNTYQSESKLESLDPANEANFLNTISKPLSLPQVSNNYSSLNSTKSELTNILTDRKTFVVKYFEQLSSLRSKGVKKTEELGNFICNGWKVKVLLLDNEGLILRGKRGTKELTKKYVWERVKNKMNSGLEEWVKFKFQFED